MNAQALFDFDGTITRKDTIKYLIWELMKLRPLRLIIVLYFYLRIIIAKESCVRQKYKNKTIGCLVKGLTDDQILPALKEFEKKTKNIFRKNILNEIAASYQKGYLVLIVTASPEFAIIGCMSEFPVIVIGTKFRKVDGVYSGEIAGKNCYGDEKVRRIKSLLKNRKFELRVTRAWSDHLSDFSMLELADERFWLVDEDLKNTISKMDPLAKFFN